MLFPDSGRIVQQFVHLHNHSHYSLLDAALKVEDLVQAAAVNGMPAVALTDHGVLFGAIEFYKKAMAAGIKPIIGMEAYIVTKGSRLEKSTRDMEPGGKRSAYHHLVLLAKDEEGYRNLIKLSSTAHLDGFYYKPRIDTDVLRLHRKGLVALSACAGGVVSSYLATGRDADAYEAGSIYKEIFGDDFYIEIQDHGIEKESIIRQKAPRLARDLGLKLVCTNDVHYLKQEHALAHNIMLFIPDSSTAGTVDYTQLRYQTDQAYFKSAGQMLDLFKDYPEAIQSTIEIAEKCDLHLDLKTNHMPQFPIPPDAGVSTLDEYFEKLAREGFSRRYPKADAPLIARLDHELSVIERMGYAGYFLIVQDFINAARERGVLVGPGRGSAAGSVVSYALGITNVDPMKYDLLFERFLNPDRISMPDIDVDFSDTKRDLVIQYVRKKYGDESVSQIITFGTLSSRAVLKDVGRVLGIPLNTIESITKQIPVEQGRVRPLADALESVPDLQWLRESTDARMKALIDASLTLEGMNRNAGMHAAGVVIAPGTISDYVPLYKTPATEVMTQYNMKDLEAVGLLKMDLLGLRTLSVIENSLRMIKQNHGLELDLDAIPLDDAATFDQFSRGDTVAIFQFESSGMQDWLRKLKPTCISDLVAMNALYRPGPMEMIGEFISRKHGAQKVTSIHPKLDTILKETYGVIVYQEQVMKIASEISGFSLAKADVMRRAMGKKDKSLMAALKKEFIDGAELHGTQRKTASEIFDLIEKFASYGFNKSHSVAYSIIAYQTAYLKACYTAEFMAATLSSEIGNTDKIVKLIDDCRKRSIQVLPPDVNESQSDFSVIDGRIRFGLCAIKNVGESAIDGVLKARAARGRFDSLFDFCARVDLRLVNKKCLESLVQAGAFDSLDSHRARFMENIERATAFGQAAQNHLQIGQSSLFEAGGQEEVISTTPSLLPAETWSEQEKLAREKAVLGFFVSGHPLLKFEDEIRDFVTVRFGEVSDFRGSVSARACGIITAVRRKIDRRNNTMAFVTLEDFTGKGECIVFSDPFSRYSSLLVEDALIMVVGKAEVNGDNVKILVNEVYPLEKVRETFTKRVILSIDIDRLNEESIVRLRELIEEHPGTCPCYIQVRNAKTTTLFQSQRYSVIPSRDFVDQVHTMLGPKSIRCAVS
jgi:DNA polymerase-3 subunit alpha